MKTFVKYLDNCADLYTTVGVSDEKIKEAEKNLELSFSKEYIEYLLKYGIASASGHEFTGLGKIKRLDVVEVTMSNKKANVNVPKDLYVIEECNIDDIVIWQSEKGNIYMTTGDSKPKKIYSSLLEYIKKS
ncbi:SMI1-KNR4 cell-wall [Lachnospiraceae bacterium RM5]|nr:SMI1-KNR4 cell-wall [Lachnospiraceae bacterium RM5]